MAISKAMEDLVRSARKRQEERHAKETEITTRLSALNTQLIFTNSSHKSPAKATQIIEGFLVKLLEGTGGGAESGSGGGGSGAVASPAVEGADPGSPQPGS